MIYGKNNLDYLDNNNAVFMRRHQTPNCIPMMKILMTWRVSSG
jgi:hypothetical protein